jgi:hypothetical protein
MKLPITIEFTSGESATYTALPPEWMKWEQKNWKHDSASI